MYKRILSAALAVCVSLSALCSVTFSASEEGSAEMREMTSAQIVKDMGLGWNLGNTLDVCNADRDGDGKADETSDNVDETLWGNPKATKELFEALKDDGIGAVRIPVTWRDHMGDAPSYTVDLEWMDRVEEVVNYALDSGMYVIINVHHDGGDDPAFGAWIKNASKDYDGVMAKYKALWSQIAERFKNYSDYLLFESMNEVGFNDLGKQEGYDLLNKMNQEFVNLIRASGGGNDKRHLVIAGYFTDIAESCSGTVMPEDPVGRCILSLHYYTPWSFCGGGRNVWGSSSDKNEMSSKFSLVKTNFTDKGIPVIMGEYGAVASDRNVKSRILWCRSVVENCYEQGIASFFWDNGEEVDRNTYEWRTEGLLDALVEAAHAQDRTSSSSSSVNSSKKTTVSTASSSAAGVKITAPAVKKAKVKKLLSKKKRTLKVTWKKQSGVSGYKIWASQSKKFKKAKKYNTIKKNLNKNKNKITIKTKKSKKYYVKIRAYKLYKKSDGSIGTALGKWSEIKSKKVK